MSGDPFIHCRGETVRQSRATIPATDHGFLYGLGLFETFRTFGGNLFLPERHLERLRRGLDAFRIDAEGGRFTNLAGGGAALRKVVGVLLEVNGLEDAVFRLTVSAGEAGPGLPRENSYGRPNELVFVRPVPPPPPTDGVAVRFLETPRLPGEFFPRGKTAGYANSIRAWLELREAGGGEPEGLLLTPEGAVSEGVFSNIFWINGGRLFTPGPENNALPGIASGMILEWAAEAGVSAAEVSRRPEEVSGAEAVFLTNAVRGPVPVARLLSAGGEVVAEPDSARHPLFRQLSKAWQARINLETARDPQAKNN